MPVGVTVEAVEVPASTTSTYNTANGFMLVLADWGPSGQAIPATNLANAASQIGTPSGSTSPYGGRTATSAVALDSVDEFFRDDGQAAPTLYMSRVVGPSPVAASLVVLDGAAATALTITAKYVGAGGNGIYVLVKNNTTTFDLSLLDGAGNTLAATTGLTSNAAAVTWLATTSYVTAVAGTGTLPATLAATPLAGGDDNRASITITQVTSALDVFSPSLGPGQVFAPNWTDTTLAGVWSALGNHAYSNNRVAICDMDDGEAVGTLVTDLGSFGTGTVASYSGFWAGNRQIPGVAVNTTRNIPPSPVIAALCARVDTAGNPNLAAAGVNYPLAYATQPESIVSGAPYDTYSMADLNTLNASGINTFQRVNGVPTNYGFVSAALSTSDQVYWQFNHARLRMFIIAEGQLLGQPYVFAQLDGQGSKQLAFQNALDGLLMNPLWKSGALYGATAADAYTIDVGSDINTPATIAAGQLNASITCSFSYFAQNVTLLINVQPITTTA